ncbi:MAG: 30S ribosomal protein S9 [Candidatus Melainabacteria bacterium]|jgi:small subunit ribosomal protein S9|uniref:Small ribosomal subunit protein uS9 n=1 Tax=Candidatus Obscuribacter phosphatis TaxID=1906157 RepID=A0A8J7P734_9BACT|nr:30S ribosomal protein S9 [Candidatus Obscuribacter phosphatis]MCA0313492.1 30S ribosomal protein S9 [Candidatus Melainabacteria bacterium]OPZ86733.1 MAG: 30S ribosomal protein S9 [bacterium ADurb.Bin425]
MSSVIQYIGTGRRKSATARVRLVPGTGQVTINSRTMDDYVGGRDALRKEIFTSFHAADAMGRFDVHVLVRGGGIAGQIGAIRHGIARALSEAAPQNRSVLRGEGLLTRDPRVKERKKYGRKRARKRFQFSKR